MKKFLIITVLLISVMLTCAPAFGDDPEAGEIVADVLLVRPLSFVGSVLGTAFFIVALPVAITSGSVKTVARKLVVEPLKYTFTRPVGEFYDPWGERVDP